MSTHLLYPDFLAWHLPLEGKTSAWELFSAKTGKKIRRARELMEEAGYTITIAPIRPKDIADFTVLYRANLATKRGAIPHDVHTVLQKRTDSGRIYQILALRRAEQLIGGLIFFRAKNGNIMTVFKVFPATLDDVRLPISPTYVAEYALFEHALAAHAQRVIHGKDRNVFGQNSAIGLAVFKLQIGCLPYASLLSTVLPLSQEALPEPVETLVFLSETRNTPIRKARLYSDRSEEELRTAYRILFDHPAFTLELCPLPPAR